MRFNRRWNQLSLPFLMGMLISGHTTKAQEYSYVHYDVRDGLAGSLVYCGVQDNDGFLWFGCETGLSRFDGTHFQNFTTADGLPDNEIIRLFVDSKNRIWIMPFRASLCYYWHGRIHNQENDALLQQIPVSSEVMDMTEDKRGNILLCERNSIYIIDTSLKISKVKGLSLNTFPVRAGLKNDSEFRIGASHIFPRHDYFALIDIKDQNASLPFDQLTCDCFHMGTWISPDLQEYFKINVNKLLFIYPDQKDSFLLPVPVNLRTTSRIDDSLFAVSGSNGTAVYNLNQKQVTNHFLKGHIVNAVLPDMEGNLWFLTAVNGIYRLNSPEMRNVFFSDSTINLPAYSIQRSDSNLLVGTDKFYLWQIGRGMTSLNKYKVNEVHANGRIISICRGEKGNIYLGTDDGVVKMHKMHVENRRTDGAIKSIVPDNNKLLVATGSCVIKIDPVTLETVDTIWRRRSTCACKNNDVIFIGTLGGLYSVNAAGETTFLGEKIPVLRTRIMGLQEGTDGMLWIATNGQGIVGYKDGMIKYHLTAADGLTSDICRNIFVDSNYIWIGTVKGLNRLKIRNGQAQITQFTTSDGLASDIINSIFVDGNMVYVGSAAGLTYFDLTKISLNSKCLLRVTDIRTHKNVWNYDTSGFILPHNENAVQFDFVGISYKSGGDITYRYRLKGVDTNWHITHQSSLNFPALPSGDYQLQLSAINKFGFQSSMTSISFRIQPLIWERIWFKVLIAIILLIFIWIIVNARIRFIRKQEDAKLQVTQKINDLEQMALKAQMNPHFIFNSLNSIQQYVIDKNLAGANKFITEFARLIRLTLELSSQSDVRLEDEINYLSTYLELENTKLEELFQYQLTVQDSVSRTNWLVPPMILQPFVENAIRHGIRYRKDKKGLIKVVFERNDNYLTCIISDNGVGRERSKLLKGHLSFPIEYQSKGMMLTAKRVEMINRYTPSPILINIEDGDTTESEYPGTKVTVSFPVKEILS